MRPFPGWAGWVPVQGVEGLRMADLTALKVAGFGSWKVKSL